MGVMQELAVHTVFGVIPLSETIMLIVPTQDALGVETRLQPADIDEVSVGQPVPLRFSAFNHVRRPNWIGQLPPSLPTSCPTLRLVKRVSD